jgi:chemotaxis protein methyltransferase WspC
MSENAAQQATIATLVHQSAGLDPSILGPGVMRNALNRRLRSCGLKHLSDYLQLLRQEPGELQALVEAAVISETWFFRDRTPFQFLAHQVKQRAKRPIRILSLPCATGEEPYSIVMSLLNHGIAPADFQVEGVDISQLNIQIAQAGIYSSCSFRNCDPAMQAQFFQRHNDRYHLIDQVKQQVQLRLGNILRDPACWRDKYDVIFCRNLLIYFDIPTRHQVLKLCQKHLRPEGLLFVGHAESGILLNEGWRSVRIPFTFAYHKPDIKPDLKRVKINPPRSVTITKRPPKITPAPAPIARHLADQGKLTEAATLCDEQLRRDPLNAEIHLLLGQIHQAQNQEKLAETCFMKVIYLQPNCLDALTHLVRLRENRGDRSGADLLQRRIDRQSIKRQ